MMHVGTCCWAGNPLGLQLGIVSHWLEAMAGCWSGIRMRSITLRSYLRRRVTRGRITSCSCCIGVIIVSGGTGSLMGLFSCSPLLSVALSQRVHKLVRTHGLVKHAIAYTVFTTSASISNELLEIRNETQSQREGRVA